MQEDLSLAKLKKNIINKVASTLDLFEQEVTYFMQISNKN